MPEVKGLAIGALGELGSNVHLFINGLSYEGALKNPEKFGTSNPVEAKGIISWYLKRRWSRIAVISAAQCRMDGMAYVGGTSQHLASRRHHQQCQADDEWCFDQERMNRESQSYHGFFGT
jgi:hypothetical protein